MKKFVIGDIHGAYLALLQCLKLSKFDYEKDLLISIGDICDGWKQTQECIEELKKIKNFIFILGNHDSWFLNFINTGILEPIWYEQGGRNTLFSYGYDIIENENDNINIPKSHIDFLNKHILYYLLDNKLFVHGGIEPTKKVENHSKNYLMWDRELITNAYKKHNPNRKDYKLIKYYDEVFVGHTTTQIFDLDNLTPLRCCNVIDIDTGAGWSGKLTIMDINTKEYWQSNIVAKLYPNEKGRI